MMSKNAQTKEEPIFSFTYIASKQNPKKFLMAIGAIGIIYILISLIFKSYMFSIISIVFAIISLPEMFFPFKYILYKDRLVVNRFFYKVRRDFSYYKKVYKDKNGFFLSPFTTKNRLESFRGLLLVIPKDKREEVEVFLRDAIEKKNSDEKKELDK